LLFGKQTDNHGIYTKFWVDLKLPTTDSLDCLPAAWVGFIENQVLLTTNSNYSLDNRPFNYSAAELAGMQYLKEYIEMKVGCCKGAESGEYCGFPIEDDVVELMVQNGFQVGQVTNLVANSTLDTTGILHKYTNVTATFGDTVINVDDAIYDMLDEYSTLFTNIGGEIWHYDASNTDTRERILSLITTGNSNPNPLYNAKPVDNQGGAEDDTANSLNYYYIDVVVVKSDIYGDVVGVRNRTNLFNLNLSSSNIPRKGMLYLLKTKNSSVNLLGVKQWTETFFQLAGIDMVSIKIISHFDEINSLKNFDAISVIGPSRMEVNKYLITHPIIIAKSFTTYSKLSYFDNIYGFHFAFADSAKIDMNVYWLAKKIDSDQYAFQNNPELTSSPFIYISTHPHDINNFYSFYENTQGKNLASYQDKESRLIGFLMLHGTGHLGGVGSRHDRGYMMDGTEISAYIQSTMTGSLPFHSFESLIQLTVDDYYRIIENTNRRFTTGF